MMRCVSQGKCTRWRISLESPKGSDDGALEWQGGGVVGEGEREGVWVERCEGKE